MGQLFDKAIRRGFSDIFDSAYGTSALENRLKGALASSLYDARLSSSGYNKARTKTVESELANRESLRGRLVEGGDANSLDRFDAGPGHAQDYMKGRVGAAKENRLVEELQRLKGLGTDKGMDYRSGAITGSGHSSIGAGRLSEEKMAIARENEDALTTALGQVIEKGIDPNTKEGQSLLVNIMARGKAVSGTDLLLPSKDKLTKAKTKTEGSKQTLNASKSGYYDSAAALKDEQIFTEEFKQDRFFALELLADEKVNQVKSQIKTNKNKIEAQIKVLMQKKQSGEIKDKEVMAKTDLLIEQGYSEILKQEKILATVAKLHKEADRIDELIKKTRAQTKGEEVDMGLALMEFLGLDTKTASGDSMRNNYTKMYVKIMAEDPILREKDPDNPGQERDIVINRTEDNPDGQKKLFSHLDAEKQKIYIQSRLIDERQQSYAMTGKTLDPKVQALVDGMMEGFTNEGSTGVADHLGNEVNNMSEGQEKTDNFAIAPQSVREKLLAPMDTQLNPNLGNPQISDADIAAMQGAMSGGDVAAPIPGGDLGLGATAGAQATQPVVSDDPVQGDVPATLGNVQNQLPQVQGGDLSTGQEDAKLASLQKIVTGNGWSANIATLFSELIATQAISQVGAERLAAMSVVELQALMTKQKDNKAFSTDILPIVQAMIKEKS